MSTDGALSNNPTDQPYAALRILALRCSLRVRGVYFDISVAELAPGNGPESGPRPGNRGELNCTRHRWLHRGEYRGSGRCSLTRSLVGERHAHLSECGSERAVARPSGQKRRCNAPGKPIRCP